MSDITPKRADIQTRIITCWAKFRKYLWLQQQSKYITKSRMALPALGAYAFIMRHGITMIETTNTFFVSFGGVMMIRYMLLAAKH